MQFWKACLNSLEEIAKQDTINTSRIIFSIVLQILVIWTRTPQLIACSYCNFVAVAFFSEVSL